MASEKPTVEDGGDSCRKCDVNFPCWGDRARCQRGFASTDPIGPDGHEWAKTEAGDEFVQSMVTRADDKRNLMWFGWALREAFVAGAEWQERRDADE
jgi:hypothetical protein